MLKPVWRESFVTYQGAFAMALRIFDWDLCMMTMLDFAGTTPQFDYVAPYWFDYRVAYY